MYIDWLNSIREQIEEYGTDQETDLVLLRNHLNMLVGDIEQDPKFKEQLSKKIYD
jgi:hypothetical protein